jgi:hypothetical protein
MSNEMNEKPIEIPIDRIAPHPGNPRIGGFNEEIVESLRGLIGDSFDPAHSLKVRRKDGVYQIVSGHNRFEASKRNGLKSLPCWVRDMGDEETNLHLLLDNTQGALCSIEKAVHIFKSVPEGEIGAGKGNEGGIRRYSRAMGNPESYVRFLRDAGEVASKCAVDCAFYKDKAMHLAQVHRLPEDQWSDWCERILTQPDKYGSAAKVKEQVDMALDPEKASRLNRLDIRDRPLTIEQIIGTLKESCAGLARDPTLEKMSAKDIAKAIEKRLDVGHSGIYWESMRDLEAGLALLTEAVQIASKVTLTESTEGEF